MSWRAFVADFGWRCHDLGEGMPRQFFAATAIELLLAASKFGALKTPK
jgi:hypothetical protein